MASSVVAGSPQHRAAVRPDGPTPRGPPLRLYPWLLKLRRSPSSNEVLNGWQPDGAWAPHVFRWYYQLDPHTFQTLCGTRDSTPPACVLCGAPCSHTSFVACDGSAPPPAYVPHKVHKRLVWVFACSIGHVQADPLVGDTLQQML